MLVVCMSTSSGASCEEISTRFGVGECGIWCHEWRPFGGCQMYGYWLCPDHQVTERHRTRALWGSFVASAGGWLPSVSFNFLRWSCCRNSDCWQGKGPGWFCCFSKEWGAFASIFESHMGHSMAASHSSIAVVRRLYLVKGVGSLQPNPQETEMFTLETSTRSFFRFR